MKKVFVIALGLVFISLLAVQTVKAQENKKVRKMVAGLWKIEDLPGMNMESVSEEDKKKVEEMIKDVKANSYLNFMQNGKYEMKMSFMGQEKKEEGTWKVDKEGSNFTTIDKEGKETTMSIGEITKNKLVLKDGVNALVLVK